MELRSKVEILKAPLLIVGSLRSGTTLLRLLIDHHPEISIFGEFEMSVAHAVGDQWPELSRFHQILANDRVMQDYGFYVDTSLDYPQLIYSFLEQAYDRNPKLFIGASVHSQIDLLPQLWPKAKFIHLIRDPRDVARSCIGMGWVGNVHEGVKYWIEAEHCWTAVCAQTPAENRLVVRYEDLVRTPILVLTSICEFIGVDYHPDMLEIEADTTYSCPDARYAEQWKTKLSEQEIGWVEYQCGDLMQARSYDLHHFPTHQPSALELFGIKLQNRQYRIQFNIKRWGLINWFLFTLSKRTGPKSFRDIMQNRINQITRAYLK